MKLRLLITAAALLLAGCEIPGMGPDPKVLQREANAKAVGGACRFGLRSIEDCYILNEAAAKADVFTGWKEMDQYMRENKLEGVRATVVKPPPEPVEEVIEDSKPKGAGKTSAKPAAH
jgi:hypothetical protein